MSVSKVLLNRARSENEKMKKKKRKMELLGSLGLYQLSNFEVGSVNLLYEPKNKAA